MLYVLLYNYYYYYLQTCLHKIRLDMPILSSDFVKGDEDDDVRRNEDFEPEEINAFDRLLGESGERSNINPSTSENVFNSSSFYSSPMPNDTVGHVLGSSFGSVCLILYIYLFHLKLSLLLFMRIKMCYLSIGEH